MREAIIELLITFSCPVSPEFGIWASSVPRNAISVVWTRVSLREESWNENLRKHAIGLITRDPAFSCTRRGLSETGMRTQDFVGEEGRRKKKK